MGALAGLVERGLVATDWAAALAPVDERIGTMGQFLRAEIAAGRSYLPAGDHILLVAEAGDEESLRHVEDVLARHLERFGARRELVVTWQTAG